MAVVRGNLINEQQLEVISISYLTDDIASGGYQVDEIPAYPQASKGKGHLMYFNPVTKEIWFEEVSRELTSEEELLDRVSALEALVASLLPTQQGV